MSYISCQNKQNEVLVWERTANGREVIHYPGIFEFYRKSDNGKFTSIYNEKLELCSFTSKQDFEQSKRAHQANGIHLYESDISTDCKVLAKHYFEAESPKLQFTLWDIEVDYTPEQGFSSVNNPYAPINAVAIHHVWKNYSRVIAVPPDPSRPLTKPWDLEEIKKFGEENNVIISLVEDERELLLELLYEMQDSDCISGWNSDNFDTPYLAKRIELVLGPKNLKLLSFPEAYPPMWDKVELFGQEQHRIRLFGRISLDYMELFKKFEQTPRPSYSLESISNELLPNLAKLTYEGSLYELYHKDFVHFLKYNVRDTEVLSGFEKKLGYLQLANELYHSACGLADHIFGTIRLTDLSLILYAHNTLNQRVPDLIENSSSTSISGAMVLIPKVGLHQHIGSIDTESLYPSMIRCVNISPDTLIGQIHSNLSNDDRKVHFGWQAVYERDTTKPITVIYDERAIRWGYKGTETHTGAQWYEILKQRNWAISGYGTIFDQSKIGIIPALLTHWFAQRKHYKKLMGDLKKKWKPQLENEQLLKKLSATDLDLFYKEKELISFYDRLQYVYKIKLNATYGATTNAYFRFFDLRLGQSTTGSGRAVLQHMCSQTAKILDGKYDMFSESIVYGDSVGADSKILINNGLEVEIQNIFKRVDDEKGTKQYHHPLDTTVLTYDEKTKTNCYRPIKYIMRHKANKRVYRITTVNNINIDVTEDHSLMWYDSVNDNLIRIQPEEIINGSISSILMKNNKWSFDYVEISKIEEIEYNDYVYDIEVEDTHTFFANNILVHNTDSCYFKTNAEHFTGTDEEIEEISIRLADTISEQVNKSFPKFVEEAFCIQNDNRYIVKCAREAVAKSGIFVSKKKYVLKLIDLDGVKVDKLKAMGLEMKKTTTPKFIQKFLVNVVEKILSGKESWSEIEKYIVEFRKQVVFDMPLIDIGLPKGVNKIEQYTEAYRLDKKTNLPGHVAASILYNSLREQYKDYESYPIVSSSKIKVFYLQKKYDRFKAVAIPTDSNSIPSWFTSEFNIDRVAHETRLIDNNLAIIFKAIDKEVPTLQTIFNNDVLEW